MRKYVLVVIIIIGAIATMVGCKSSATNEVVIHGMLSGLNAGEMVTCLRPAADRDSIPQETFTTTLGSDGSFTFHIPVGSDRGDWYRLWIGSTPEPAKSIMLYLDAGVVNIVGKGSFDGAVYSGNKDMDAYGAFLKGYNKAEGEANAAGDIAPLSRYIAGWINSNPTSSLGTALLETYKSNGIIHVDSVIAYFSKRSQSALHNLPAARLQQWIDNTEDIMPGKPAPVFAMADTLGKQVSLKDFRGKYVLVDFWASWCGPCRAENPNLVKAFHQYKDKGFTVLGVSLDQPGGKQAWLQAIHKDGLDWTQVSDLKYFDNAAAKLYHVNAIPSNFLIDPNGVIIARNLRADLLTDRLAALFH